MISMMKTPRNQARNAWSSRTSKVPWKHDDSEQLLGKIDEFRYRNTYVSRSFCGALSGGGGNYGPNPREGVPKTHDRRSRGIIKLLNYGSFRSLIHDVLDVLDTVMAWWTQWHNNAAETGDFPGGKSPGAWNWFRFIVNSWSFSYNKSCFFACTLWYVNDHNASQQVSTGLNRS